MLLLSCHDICAGYMACVRSLTHFTAATTGFGQVKPESAPKGPPPSVAAKLKEKRENAWAARVGSVGSVGSVWAVHREREESAAATETCARVCVCT